MFIEEGFYKEILKVLPIICIDAVIVNERKQILLVKRTNEPLAGELWLPGGRIRHFEHTDATVERVIKQELSIDISNFPKKVIGVYQDFFESNSFESVKYHAMSIVYEIQLPGEIEISLDSQGSKFQWENELPKRFKEKLITFK